MNAIRILALFVLLAAAGSVQAQTSTPVPIVVNMNEFFGSASTWIDNFIGVFSIIIGVPLAIAVILFAASRIEKFLPGGR